MAPEPLGEGANVWQLHSARRAPRAPEIHQHYLARKIFQGKPPIHSGQRLEHDGGELAADGGVLLCLPELRFRGRRKNGEHGERCDHEEDGDNHQRDHKGNQATATSGGW